MRLRPLHYFALAVLAAGVIALVVIGDGTMGNGTGDTGIRGGDTPPSGEHAGSSGLGGGGRANGGATRRTDAGVIDGAIAHVPRPQAVVPEELRATESAARNALRERQLEHLRTALERAEAGEDPEAARVFRARLEALEEARRQGVEDGDGE